MINSLTINETLMKNLLYFHHSTFKTCSLLNFWQATTACLPTADSSSCTYLTEYKFLQILAVCPVSNKLQINYFHLFMLYSGLCALLTLCKQKQVAIYYSTAPCRQTGSCSPVCPALPPAPWSKSVARPRFET
jgi:hypothetical protein